MTKNNKSFEDMQNHFECINKELEGLIDDSRFQELSPKLQSLFNEIKNDTDELVNLLEHNQTLFKEAFEDFAQNQEPDIQATWEDM